jgi:coenzyme PQQ synthesis protein D (PqqD)
VGEMTAELRIRRDALEWREVEGEVVALDLRGSEYLAVNRSGALLWRELTRGATRDQLAALLQERFGLDAAAARSDVEAFIDVLSSRDLLET